MPVEPDAFLRAVGRYQQLHGVKGPLGVDDSLLYVQPVNCLTVATGGEAIQSFPTHGYTVPGCLSRYVVDAVLATQVFGLRYRDYIYSGVVSIDLSGPPIGLLLSPYPHIAGHAGFASHYQQVDVRVASPIPPGS